MHSATWSHFVRAQDLTFSFSPIWSSMNPSTRRATRWWCRPSKFRGRPFACRTSTRPTFPICTEWRFRSRSTNRTLAKFDFRKVTREITSIETEASRTCTTTWTDCEDRRTARRRSRALRRLKSVQRRRTDRKSKIENDTTLEQFVSMFESLPFSTLQKTPAPSLIIRPSEQKLNAKTCVCVFL